ncbi:DNA-binding winged helix-turn-helix (wHTH) protein [Actinoplanes octamycinicus]|uniref:DNA-binding winged helix-turn-helix (WHTH) protein n=1 Tax=Actinoplanes octamycinicus TaxID=135948 RepID=A0A7W7GU50_9ACTN|nr:hypothetical protein [Actinoplanes octamycinicus]MBB4738358.1 DNA-binding winged helix-turn-helix (wHTH) protein [Actinoplanes octamycinicus]GIE57475.1 hypothetical protein Aoc01nite_28770 [Actinoplanes octamycinicus]
MRWMSRLATALITLAALAGPPLIAGLWLAHRPWPPLSPTGIKAWLQQPRTLGDLLALVVLVAAVLWILTAGYLARRHLTALTARWRHLQHLPLPSPAQMTASSMAGVAALTLPTLTADHPATPTATSTTPPVDPASRQQAPAPPDTTAQMGITLPGGGWLPYPTALAISATAGLLWLHRRRIYQPSPHRIGTHHTDPDLQPLPATINAITTATADSNNASDPHPGAQVTPDNLPAGPLHLHGTGAPAAARGLIVAAALTAAAGRAATSHISISRDDWTRLLPELDPTTLPGVSIHDSAAGIAAPGAMQDHGKSPTGDARSSQPPTPVTTILLKDPTTPAARWQVDDDGVTTGRGITYPRRLCTLDHQTAVDLLALFHQRRTPRQPATTRPPAQPAATASIQPTAGRLALLGECTLTLHGEPVRLRRTAGLQILAYLAVHPNGASRSELISAIWPQLAPATITQRLHTTLSDLRVQLRPTIEEPVTRHGDHYQLGSDIGTDLRTWRATTTAITTAVTIPARTRACRQLLQMYRGELAATYTWPWINPAREAVRRDALDACLYLAEHTPAAEALDILTTATAIDPYNAAVQQRMAALNLHHR